MGCDAEIYVRAKTEEPNISEPLPRGYSLFLVCRDDRVRPDGATHYIDVCTRVWCPKYPIGPWPQLCECLLILMGSKDITAVWYGSADGSIGVNEMTADTLAEYCRHYAKAEGH